MQLINPSLRLAKLCSHFFSRAFTGVCWSFLASFMVSLCGEEECNTFGGLINLILKAASYSAIGWGRPCQLLSSDGKWG